MNPFQFEHAQPWAADVVDVETLNAEVSDAVRTAVEAVRGGELHPHSLLVLGPAGAGKTHLFARLRRQLGPRAAFVLLRPELGADATPRHVLAAALDALHRRALTGDQKQLDVVVGSVFAAVREDSNKKYPHLVLEVLSSLDEEAREEAIEEVVEHVEERFEDVDLEWLGTFLRAPFMSRATRRAALTWLSGREPNERALRRLGYTRPLDDEAVLPALRTLGVVAAFGAPILLVFDQLENLVEPGDDARIIAHANLVAELYDTVRGLVIVQMALDGVWNEAVSPLLNEAARSRLERRVLFTQMPDGEQREALVRAWTGKVDEVPHPFPWPFASEDWERVATASVMTPRMLMKACRDALAGGVILETETEPEADRDRLRELWEAQLEQARAELEHAWKEHDGVALTRVNGALMAALKLLEVDFQRPKNKKAKYQLRLLTKDGERLVYVMQQPHPRSVSAVLKDAVGNAAKRSVLVLREQAMAVPPRWKKANDYLDELDAAKGGRWLTIDRRALTELLAVHDFLSAARSQDLSGDDGQPLDEEEVRAWMRRELGVEAWPVVASCTSIAPTVAEGEPATTSDPGTVEPATVVPAKVEPGTAEGALMRLGVASLDRVVRELRSGGVGVSRREVREALEAAGTEVTWFGREVVYWRGAAQ